MGPILAAALWFTTPSFGADTLISDCVTVDSTSRQNIVAVELWRSLCGGSGVFYFVREKSTVSAHYESLEVDTTLCSTYGVRVRNARGLPSCFAYATVGIPPTSVDPRPSDDDSEQADPGISLGKWGLFDLRGGRVSADRRLTDGIYFEVGTRGIRRIVVLSGKIHAKGRWRPARSP